MVKILERLFKIEFQDFQCFRVWNNATSSIELIQWFKLLKSAVRIINCAVKVKKILQVKARLISLLSTLCKNSLRRLYRTVCKFCSSKMYFIFITEAFSCVNLRVIHFDAVSQLTGMIWTLSENEAKVQCYYKYYIKDRKTTTSSKFPETRRVGPIVVCSKWVCAATSIINVPTFINQRS